MIVTVIPVGEVQVSVHQIAGVVAVRHRLVTASGTVHVTLLVSGALMIGGALGGIGLIDFQAVLLDLSVLGVVQAAIVQIIDVAVMLDGSVSTIGTVSVVVMTVLTRHSQTSITLVQVFK